MNHEMNTLAIGRQEAFSTMVSNKVPATAHCLSDGIHKAKESRGEQKGTAEKAEDCGEEGKQTRWKNMGIGEKKKLSLSGELYVFLLASLTKQHGGIHSE